MIVILIWQKYLFPSNWSFSGRGHTEWRFTKDEQKMLALWRNWHSATHADLVYDVTDTDLQIQNVVLKAGILRLSDVEFYRN